MAYDRTKDRNADQPRRRADPATTAAVVVPSNTVDFATYPSAIYIGQAGNVAITPLNAPTDTAVVLEAHPIGYLLVRARRVWVTGTTAAKMVALGV